MTIAPRSSAGRTTEATWCARCMTAWRRVWPSSVPPGSRVATTSRPVTSRSQAARRAIWVDLPAPSPPSIAMKYPGALTAPGYRPRPTPGTPSGRDPSSLAGVAQPDLRADLVHGPHDRERVVPGEPRALGRAGRHLTRDLGGLVLQTDLHLAVEGPAGAVVADHGERGRRVEVALHLDPALGTGDDRRRRRLGPQSGVQGRLDVARVLQHHADLAVDAGLGQRTGRLHRLRDAEQVVREGDRVDAQVEQRAAREVRVEQPVLRVEREPLTVVGGEVHDFADLATFEDGAQRRDMRQEPCPHAVSYTHLRAH